MSLLFIAYEVVKEAEVEAEASFGSSSSRKVGLLDSKVCPGCSN